LNKERVHQETLKAPVNVTWEITGKCNLRCTHCLSAEIRNHCLDELDFDQCCRFIDDLDRMEVFQINFGGGEPFLRGDFLQILGYAHSKNITTCVSTNGTTITSSLAQNLANMELLYVQVSLDGAQSTTNDAIRGKGTFEQIISGIELLVKEGFNRMSTNTVVTALNFREIKQIHELGRDYGIRTRLSRFRPSGDAKEVWEEYRLSKHQLTELSEFLSTHKDILTGDSFFSITSSARRELGLNMCGAAKMTLCVMPDGIIYPCAFLQGSIFRAGNITCESLASIWRDAPIFNRLRAIRRESCESCSRFTICHGGCPAVAYFLTNTLHHPDPECVATFQGDQFSQEFDNGESRHAGAI
jgi:mycofactocin biosynthetic radical S-adenosylmethionine protein MftC